MPAGKVPESLIRVLQTGCIRIRNGIRIPGFRYSADGKAWMRRRNAGFKSIRNDNDEAQFSRISFLPARAGGPGAGGFARAGRLGRSDPLHGQRVGHTTCSVNGGQGSASNITDVRLGNVDPNAATKGAGREAPTWLQADVQDQPVQCSLLTPLPTNPASGAAQNRNARRRH